MQPLVARRVALSLRSLRVGCNARLFETWALGFSGFPKQRLSLEIADSNLAIWNTQFATHVSATSHWLAPRLQFSAACVRARALHSRDRDWKRSHSMPHDAVKLGAARDSNGEVPTE
jgi:hypothetical protein